MRETKQQGPKVYPSLDYFKPYGQTIIGFMVVGLLVVLLVLGVQLMVGV